jgi:catechol 2,3-dioxygenase-like lactoylglutathione lyase family enzyme
MAEFRTEGLDHVAVAVRDLERSTRFYAELLGLERTFEDEWDVPRFMLANGSGLALFPADAHPSSGPESATPAIRILHIAFRVDREGFEAAQAALADAGIEFRFSDHGVSHSIYFPDPDRHQLELTTYELD